MTIMVELDERRRLSLGKIGRHSRYLVREQEDGTLVFEPAVVLTEFEARALGSQELMDQLQDSQDPERRRTRVRRHPHATTQSNRR